MYLGHRNPSENADEEFPAQSLSNSGFREYSAQVLGLACEEDNGSGASAFKIVRNKDLEPSLEGGKSSGDSVGGRRARYTRYELCRYAGGKR